MSSTPGRAAGPRSWAAFFAWLLVGAAFMVGLLSILTVGVPILLVAVVATVALGLSKRARAGVPGLVSGLAVPLFYVAYLNRSGPGQVCTTTAEVTSCVEQWSPWGWIAAGVVLLVAGAALFARRP
ncbi:MAG: hypothetical protein L0H96_12270 [Humibacillus sp.]|nr:hypothetical protein [Humibacillus sp.]MDN5777681.1 hypothetical protein [Humibacillus sp.]